jgi:hypothetical protein
MEIWYHGSPNPIGILLPGSTITREIDLARAFSHKPGIVSIEEDLAILASGVPRIRHNGVREGILYVVDEEIHPDNIYPHPFSTMPPGYEWLTRKPLRLRRIGPTIVEAGEFLDSVAVQTLLERQSARA